MARRLRFSNATEIRKSLAKVANWTLNGEVDVKVANAITLSANAMINAIKTCEMEDEIAEIRGMLDDKKSN